MPTIDPVKNLIFVKESQARRKDKIGVEEFNRIHSNDQSNYRDKQRQKGEEEYKKKNADYMKAYRLAKKLQKQPQQPDIKTSAANGPGPAGRSLVTGSAVRAPPAQRFNRAWARPGGPSCPTRRGPGQREPGRLRARARCVVTRRRRDAVLASCSGPGPSRSPSSQEPGFCVPHPIRSAGKSPDRHRTLVTSH